MKDRSLRLLIIEDSEDDVLLIIQELKKGGYNPVYERVETAGAMKKTLKEKQWDIILSDNSLPKLNAPSVMAILKKTNIDIPLIILSGDTGEENAVKSMHSGAQDYYITQTHLSRLCPAISSQLEESTVRDRKKQMESQMEDMLEVIRKGEEKYRTILESIQEGYFEVDLKGNFTFFNNSLCRILGYSEEELMGVNNRVYTDEETAKEVYQAFNKVYTTGEPSKGFDWPFVRKDGTKGYLEASIILQKSSSGKPTGFKGIVRDITERKQAEEVIRQNEEKYRTILESFQEGYFEVDLKGNFTFSNDSMYQLIGYSKVEWLGMNYRVFLDEENAIRVYQEFNKIYRTGEPSKGFDWPYIRKDGTIRYIESSIILRKDSSGKPLGFKGMVRDITERKQVEKKLIESEERFRSVVEKSSVGVAIVDDKFLVSYVNKECCNISGYSEQELVGINFTSLLAEESKIFAAERYQSRQRGEDVPSQYEFIFVRKNGEKRTGEVRSAVYLDSLGKVKSLIQVIDITERKTVAEALKKSELKYRNIFENAIEGIYQSTIEGRFITANNALARMAGYDSPEELIESIKDIGTQLYVRPEDRDRFMEIMNLKGFVEGFEVEFYKKDGSTFWVVINARTVKDDQGEIFYFEGLIEDISTRKYAEKQLQQTLASLRKAVGSTIQVLVSALESRDTYTSGHQSRTADLACAIAREMGLALDKIEGIRMAGVIHDIGKLSIPAEILSKPTKLREIEFSLIKEHARSGYEMLKDVESAWPLAEIVYQHHERINGTGYPRKLEGNEILIESRILAVADVVEAMASHRPYRAALGIDATLEEIEKNKGILYDTAVADACLRLFREKGFQLK